MSDYPPRSGSADRPAPDDRAHGDVRAPKPLPGRGDRRRDTGGTAPEATSRDDRTQRGGGGDYPPAAPRGGSGYPPRGGYDSQPAGYDGARGGQGGTAAYDDRASAYGAGNGTVAPRGGPAARTSGPNDARGGRNGRGEYDSRDAGRGSYDEDDGYAADDRRESVGGGRRAAGSSRSGGGQAAELRQRALNAAGVGVVSALAISVLVHFLTGGGSSKSIAGISLNTQLLELIVVAIPVTLIATAAGLRYRLVEPMGLTWGYGAVASMSWLGLLFMAQVENIIPHLPPLVSVPIIVGGAFATGAVLTDGSTTDRGRYACLAAVLASHIGIIAIIAKIVLA